MRIGHVVAFGVALVWALALRGNAAAVATTAVALVANATNQVGLVVDFGGGVVVTQCVQFVETQLTGYDVLNKSGLSMVVSASPGLGVSVCKINGTGCSSNPCFCAMPNYWSYWNLTNGAWVYSVAGATNTIRPPGAVDGWRWGGSAPPTVVTFDQICGTAPTPTIVIIPSVSPTTSSAATVTPVVVVNSAAPTPTFVTRLIGVPPTNTIPLPTAPQAPTQTPFPAAATPSLPKANSAAALTPAIAVAPTPIEVSSTPKVSLPIAGPTTDLKETTTPDSLVAVDSTATPVTVSNVANVPTAAPVTVGDLSPTASSVAKVSAPTATDVTSVELAQVRSNPVVQPISLSTRVPPHTLLAVTSTSPPEVTTDAAPQRANVPIGYVVLGCAILGLLVYLVGGRRDS